MYHSVVVAVVEIFMKHYAVLCVLEQKDTKQSACNFLRHKLSIHIWKIQTFNVLKGYLKKIVLGNK